MVELLTPEQVAKSLHTTTGVLATWRHTGRYDLPFIKMGRKVLYKADDVQNWLDSRMQNHTGERLQKGGF
jgi:excisionase family DNA binding protein